MARSRLIAAGLAVALVGASCGGGGGSDPAARQADTPTTTSSASDAEPVNVDEPDVAYDDDHQATTEDDVAYDDEKRDTTEDDAESDTARQEAQDAQEGQTPTVPDQEQEQADQSTTTTTAPDDDPEGSTSGTSDPQDSTDDSPASSGASSADQEGTGQSTAEPASEPPEETVESTPLADPEGTSSSQPSDEVDLQESDQTQSNTEDTSCSPAAMELLGLSEGASCGSAFDLPSQPPEESLVRAITETLEDVYVTKGTARLEAIFWSDEPFAEWSHVYEAAGRAADAMQIQPVPTIDDSSEWCWLYVPPVGGAVFLDEDKDVCLPTRPPVMEQHLELLVPVVGGTETYRRTILRWDGKEEIIYGGYQKFRRRDNRWKLDWRYWCLTIGEAQGENGVRLFEMTGQDEFDVVFRCEE